MIKSKPSKNSLVTFVVLGVLALILLVASLLSAGGGDRMAVNGEMFSYEVSDSVEERALGLSGREGMPQDHAMLFIFPAPIQSGIWMKDMNFPIDIVWLDTNKTVIYLEEDVAPETYPEIFYPDTKANYVVEFNAGTAESIGLEIGDTLKF